MNQPLIEFRPEFVDIVTPGGYWHQRLSNISNYRMHRWNAYVRACDRIPKTSPVYGSTSFATLNERRHHLIAKRFDGKGRNLDEDAEFKALQEATGEWLCGPIVAQNFILGRYLRRLKAKHPELRDLP